MSSKVPNTISDKETFDRIDLAAVAAKERANRARWEREKQEQQKRKGR